MFDRLIWSETGQAETEKRLRLRTEMRTPFVKRIPIVASLTIALVVAYVVADLVDGWVGLAALLVTAAVFAVILRYWFGLPWTRILRYREPGATSDE